MKRPNGFSPFAWNPFLSISSNFIVPGVPMNKILEAYRRNLETLSQLSQVTMTYGQAMARCQSEAVQQSLNNCVRALESLTEQTPANNKMKQTAELAQQAWQDSASAAKEMVDIVTRSNREVFETVSQRMQESLVDLQDLTPTAQRRTGTKS